MKTRGLLFLVFFMISIFSAYAQKGIGSTAYIEPGYNIVTSGFGYPVNYTGPNNSLNTYGAGMGVGMIFYLTESEEPRFLNLGMDYTIAELVVNSNNIAYLETDYDNTEYITETSLVSRMISMKLGPVVTIVPRDRVAVDFYVQGQMGLSMVNFYNDKLDKIEEGADFEVQYRLAGGIRIGYYKTFLKLEYNYGAPTFKKAAELNANSGSSLLIDKHTIDQSYFRIALCVKFNSF